MWGADWGRLGQGGCFSWGLGWWSVVRVWGVGGAQLFSHGIFLQRVWVGPFLPGRGPLVLSLFYSSLDIALPWTDQKELGA